MVQLTTLTALAGALAAPALAQQLSKPALRNDLGAFGIEMDARLRNPGFTITPWPADVIADGCLSLARRENQDPRQYRTHEVLYGDCVQPWLLCRHINHPTSINTLALRAGQAPVRMRQYTKDLFFVPTGGGAYALGNQLVFFGAQEGSGVFLHEITHTADFYSGFQTSGQWLGNQQVWMDAYNADTHVPDNYARTNQIENVAQFPMFVLANMLVPGGAAAIEPNVGAIDDQIRVWTSQAQNADYGGDMVGQSGVCTARHPNSVPVPNTSALSAEGEAFIAAYATRRLRAAVPQLPFKEAGNATECAL